MQYFEVVDMKKAPEICNLGRLESFQFLIVYLHPVNKEVQQDPDHINKVPVPFGSQEPEMFFRCEVTFFNADTHDG